jgi:DNA integrity scanning protein DisA with diadenylate cyclase activity
MRGKFVQAGVKLAEEIDADAIIIISDFNKEPKESQGIQTQKKVLHVSRDGFASHILSLRDVALIAYMNGMEGVIVGIIDDDSVVVCRSEMEWLRCLDGVNPDAIRAILNVGRRISNGALFVVGDVENVLKKSHQSIINPFKGHSVDIKDNENWETIVEFSQLDGAFILDGDGKVISAGRYMDISGSIQRGVGGRHIAAESITRDTKATAIAISQSGVTRIYKNGEMVVELFV